MTKEKTISKNGSSKSLSESLARLEEQLHDATQEGNKRQIDAIKAIIRRLKSPKKKY